MSFQAMAAAIKIRTGSPASKNVLLVLANYADENNECFPSVSRISKDTEISERSVHRALNHLVEGGFLSIKKRFKNGKQASSKYRLTLWQSDKKQTAKPALQTAKSAITDCHSGRHNLSLEPITKPIDQFEEFWSLYPKKVAKKKAHQKYKLIIKNKEATAKQMIEALKLYCDKVKGKDAEFILHPTTWLNGERWLDDYGPREKTEWDVKMEHWKSGGWLTDWGPEPGQPGCKVPSEYLISQVKERTA